MKTLYLIPSSLGEQEPQLHASIAAVRALEQVDLLFVEHAKSARAFIKQQVVNRPISSFKMLEVSHKEGRGITDLELIEELESVKVAGFMSDAGLPCVADPGAKVVQVARKLGFVIKPLSGPSSIMLALMASGFNGQQFCFHGYLPIQPKPLKDKLVQMEQAVLQNGYTQAFIETPYRNKALMQMLTQVLKPHTLLSIAANVLGENESIHTRSVGEWRRAELWPGKEPAVFLLGVHA